MYRLNVCFYHYICKPLSVIDFNPLTTEPQSSTFLQIFSWCSAQNVLRAAPGKYLEKSWRLQSQESYSITFHWKQTRNCEKISNMSDSSWNYFWRENALPGVKWLRVISCFSNDHSMSASIAKYFKLFFNKYRYVIERYRTFNILAVCFFVLYMYKWLQCMVTI